MSQQIWFTSDNHFAHGSCDAETGERKGTLKWRTQFNSLEEMEETIIDNHNKIVKPTDVVYDLGDFIWRGKPDSYIERLNGYFYMIRGNHDAKVKHTHKRVQHVVDGFYNINIQKQPITISHFPLLAWNKSYHGAWHLHGHSHVFIPEWELCKRINVGWDIWHRPVNFDEIKEIMDTRIIDKKENGE